MKQSRKRTYEEIRQTIKARRELLLSVASEFNRIKTDNSIPLAKDRRRMADLYLESSGVKDTDDDWVELQQQKKSELAAFISGLS